jgi:hypothetical protein
MRTQEFDVVAGKDEGILPPGWIQRWDNPGGRCYFFNTLDHDTQYDMVVVLEKGALPAEVKTEELSPSSLMVLFQATITPP